MIGRITRRLEARRGVRYASSAVVFDVDGVLIRGAETVESAPGVLRGLRERDVPFMLMTNGGGYHESTRAKKLTERFGVEIHDDQIIQSHTPMRELVPKYKDEPVLLVGKRYEHLLHLAKEYGFKYPVSIEQYHKEFPLLYPDMDPVDCEALPSDLDLKQRPIRAVLALTDPLMWGRELQICCDVLGSNGLPGSVLSDQGVPLYSSCADFVYVVSVGARSARIQITPLSYEISLIYTTKRSLIRSLRTLSNTGTPRSTKPVPDLVQELSFQLWKLCTKNFIKEKACQISQDMVSRGIEHLITPIADFKKRWAINR